MTITLLLVSLAQLAVSIFGLLPFKETEIVVRCIYGGIYEGFHRAAARGDPNPSCCQDSVGSLSSALSFNWFTEQSPSATSSRILPKYFAWMSFPSAPGWQ